MEKLVSEIRRRLSLKQANIKLTILSVCVFMCDLFVNILKLNDLFLIILLRVFCMRVKCLSFYGNARQ